MPEAYDDYGARVDAEAVRLRTQRVLEQADTTTPFVGFASPTGPTWSAKFAKDDDEGDELPWLTGRRAS